MDSWASHRAGGWLLLLLKYFASYQQERDETNEGLLSLSQAMITVGSPKYYC